MSDQVQNPYNLDGAPDEQPSETTAFNRIVAYNENSAYHKGTDIEFGGFGIEMKDGLSVPPFGRIQTVGHQGDRATKYDDEMVARSIEVAIVGASPKITGYWPDGNKNGKAIPLPAFTKNPNKEAGGRTNGLMALFVVFKCDPLRQVFELPAKTYRVDDFQGILAAVDRAASGVCTHFGTLGTKISKLPRYAVWVTLSAGKTRQEGNPASAFTETLITWPKPTMSSEDYFNLRVTPQDFEVLKSRAIEVKALLDSGYRQPKPVSELPRLVEAYYAGKTTAAQVLTPDRPKLAPVAHPLDFEDAALPLPEYMAKFKGNSAVLLGIIHKATGDKTYTFADALAVNQLASPWETDMTTGKFVSNLVMAGLDNARF